MKEGDNVRLNSGGPEMVIFGINGDLALCQWQDDEGKVQYHHFYTAQLTPLS